MNGGGVNVEVGGSEACIRAAAVVCCGVVVRFTAAVLAIGVDSKAIEEVVDHIVGASSGGTKFFAARGGKHSLSGFPFAKQHREPMCLWCLPAGHFWHASGLHQPGAIFAWNKYG